MRTSYIDKRTVKCLNTTYNFVLNFAINNSKIYPSVYWSFAMSKLRITEFQWGLVRALLASSSGTPPRSLIYSTQCQCRRVGSRQGPWDPTKCLYARAQWPGWEPVWTGLMPLVSWFCDGCLGWPWTPGWWTPRACSQTWRWSPRRFGEQQQPLR